MRYIVLFIVGLLLIPYSTFSGDVPVSPEDVQLIQTDFAASQLSAYYDLRERKTLIQVTNVTNSPVTIHVQIFQHDRGCSELNFDDTLTGLDTVIYDLDDVIKNSGDPAPLSLADDSYGYVVVSDREIDGMSLTPSLIGNFRIVDNTEYEYRSNMLGVSPGNPPLSDLSEITFQAHFNTADNASFADLVGYVYDGSETSSVRNFAPGINFDVFVYDLGEEPLSCDRRNFACGNIMNYGVNEDYPSSKDENVICPGGGLVGGPLTGGFVNFINGSLGATPSSPVDNVFVYLVGINNGNGTGSMDTWFDPTVVPTLPPMEVCLEDGETECIEDADCCEGLRCDSGTCDVPEICNNQIDDADDDTEADCADPECPDGTECDEGRECNEEQSCQPPEDCTNDTDDDSDGLTDCEDTFDCPPIDSNTAGQCGNEGTSEETCSDNFDNDGDSNIDCFDEDCLIFTTICD